MNTLVWQRKNCCLFARWAWRHQLPTNPPAAALPAAALPATGRGRGKPRRRRCARQAPDMASPPEGRTATTWAGLARAAWGACRRAKCRRCGGAATAPSRTATRRSLTPRRARTSAFARFATTRPAFSEASTGGAGEGRWGSLRRARRKRQAVSQGESRCEMGPKLRSEAAQLTARLVAALAGNRAPRGGPHNRHPTQSLCLSAIHH